MNQPHYLHVGWLIDGSGDPIRKNILLKILDGKISDLDNFPEKTLPSHQTLTDLSGCTVLPPFIDSHVHLSLSGTVNRKERQKQIMADYSNIRPLISQHIDDHLTHGVLAVRDGGDRFGHALRYKMHDRDVMHSTFNLKAAGKAWHQKGRYGGMLGRHPEGKMSLANAYSSETDPIDHVKIINSGPNSLTDYAVETPPQFDREALRNTVIRARADGRKVMIHANGRLPVRLAIDSGCHSIEHGFFMGRENLQRMADENIFWVPTAVAMKALLNNSDNIDTCGPEVIEQNLHHQMEQISIARKYGVRIALGTDSGSLGVFHGKAVAEELDLLIQAGLTMPEAISCATKNGAELLGLENKGVIAGGMPADFLVFQCPPDQLQDKLSSPAEIYLGGHPRRRNTELP